MCIIIYKGHKATKQIKFRMLTQPGFLTVLLVEFPGEVHLGRTRQKLAGEYRPLHRLSVRISAVPDKAANPLPPLLPAEGRSPLHCLPVTVPSCGEQADKTPQFSIARWIGRPVMHIKLYEANWRFRADPPGRVLLVSQLQQIGDSIAPSPFSGHIQLQLPATRQSDQENRQPHVAWRHFPFRQLLHGLRQPR
jgi:hypothetical protein